MKVWNIVLHAYRDLFIPGQAEHNRQVRVVVCAKSQKRVVELVNATRFRFLTLGHLRDFGSRTENKAALEVANNQEGVWWAPLDGPHQETYTRAVLRLAIISALVEEGLK